jgi:hypothetical protein
MTSFDFIPGFTEQHGAAVETIEATAANTASRIERESAALVRPDGTPRHTPEEHAERLQAIVQAATDEYDRLTARHAQQAEETVADAERRLTLLGGSDPLDALTDAERHQAAARREFVREDTLGMDPGALAARVRAVVASGDKVTAVLINRYLKERTAGTNPALTAAHEALTAFLGIDGRLQRERDIEAEIRRAKALAAVVDGGRSAVDGRHERMVSDMRRRAGVGI